MTPLILLELTRGDLEAVLDQFPGLRAQVEGSVFPRIAGRALLHCDELTPLPARLRDELARAFVQQSRNTAETLIEPGEEEQLICVAEGSVRIGDRVLGEGSVFGTGALHGAQAAESVVALQPVRLLVLPVEALQRFRRDHAAELEACARLAAGKSRAD